MENKIPKMKWHQQAQAATEVAIFGAIIIFLIGMIIRSTISSQYAQNQNFKAMKLALSKSLESVRNDKTERNNATVMYIEDRLVPDFNKFGSLERTPFVAQGSGSMSNLIMYPIDEADVNNSISKLDFFINGQYFPFTTSALRAKIIVPPINYPLRIEAVAVPGRYIKKGWDYHCKCSKAKVNNVMMETCYACPIFYQSIPKGSPDFCYGTGCHYLYEAEVYDLNRNDIFTDDPQEFVTDKSRVRRSRISWQWNGVPGIVGDKKTGFAKEIRPNAAVYPVADIDYDRKEETVYGLNRVNLNDLTVAKKKRESAQQNDAMNIDIKEQVALAGKTYPGGEAGLIADLKMLREQGIVTDVMVVDYQDGDIDLTHDNTSQGSQRGLQQETAIYTRMRQESGTQKDKGTYFLVKDGKAFNPETGNFVRSVSKRDQVDLVERHILLSNNTWRFCSRAGTSSTPLPNPPACIGNLLQTDGTCEVGVNPVEVCVTDTGNSERSGCFSQANVAKTCLDTTSKMLYVRSRIVNRGGHKWITDATDKRPAINIR